MHLPFIPRKKIPECHDFGDLSRVVLGVEPPPAPDVDNLLRGFSGARENGTRETHFLEFKAHYLPKPGDDSPPAACKWNVVEAMISMVNAWGGCILLGIGEDKSRKELYHVDIGYDAFINADSKHEDRHFATISEKNCLVPKAVNGLSSRFRTRKGTSSTKSRLIGFGTMFLSMCAIARGSKATSLPSSSRT